MNSFHVVVPVCAGLLPELTQNAQNVLNIKLPAACKIIVSSFAGGET